jgi:signal transduction histidine kinase
VKPTRLKGDRVFEMADYTEGSKKEVAEVKFLIHDLRVERFINEVIHFHATLDTDLEIYSIEQAQILHGQDLQILKAKAVSLRKAFQEYSSAVKNFSPDRTILLAGKNYVETIRGTCALILNPLWGRADKVLDFLPAESRSSRSREHYRNCIHWIAGVSRRIEHFLQEQQNKQADQDFDLADELEDFTRQVARPYVTERTGSRVDLRLDKLDSARICGSQPRFRRMYFNLIMNAADAMTERKLGVIDVSAAAEGDRVALRVRDNGSGMAGEKIQQLLADRETLDGELHSLGFVFVRQTVAELNGELSIESAVGEGTTVTVSLPVLPGKVCSPAPASEPGQSGRVAGPERTPKETAATASQTASAPGVSVRSGDGKHASCGRILYDDYQSSEAEFPGGIFAISVGEDDSIDFLAHRPYEHYWSMNHEDLSPMYFEATFRGRLEEDDLKRPVLTLKEPQSIGQYFDLKNVPEGERSAARHLQMVHDEYIRIARKLIGTGFPPDTGVELTGLPKFFPGQEGLSDSEPFPLRLLANQALTGEERE